MNKLAILVVLVLGVSSAVFAQDHKKMPAKHKMTMHRKHMMHHKMHMKHKMVHHKAHHMGHPMPKAAPKHH